MELEICHQCPSKIHLSLQVLDGISDEKMTFKVCEALLNRTDLQTSLFVLHYMLTRLSHSVAMNRSHYSNRLLGAKVRIKGLNTDFFCSLQWRFISSIHIQCKIS